MEGRAPNTNENCGPGGGRRGGPGCMSRLGCSRIEFHELSVGGPCATLPS